MKIVNYIKNFFYQPLFMLFSATIISLIFIILITVLVLATIGKMIFGISNKDLTEKLQGFTEKTNAATEKLRQ